MVVATAGAVLLSESLHATLAQTSIAVMTDADPRTTFIRYFFILLPSPPKCFVSHVRNIGVAGVHRHRWHALDATADEMAALANLTGKRIFVTTG
jgi:hypothetical protein